MRSTSFFSKQHEAFSDKDVLAFTQKNSHYYQYKWKRAFGFGQWNWSATLFGPFWFAYRKQPIWALFILALLVGFDFWQSTSPYYFSLAIEPLLLSGLLANHLYYLAFKKHLNSPSTSAHHLSGPDWKGLTGFIVLFFILITMLPSVLGLNLFQSKVMGFELQSIIWTAVKSDKHAKEIKLLRREYQQAYYNGHFQRSVHMNQQALNLAILKLGSDHQLTIALQSELIATTLEGGRHQEALNLSNDMLAQYELKFGKDHLFTTFVSNNIVSNHIYQGHYNLAKTMAYNCLIIWEKYPKDLDHPVILNKKASIYSNMGVIQQAFCNFEEAEDYHQEALQLSLRASQGYSLETCRYLIRLGDYFKEKSRYDDANHYYKEAQKIVEQLIKTSNPILALIYTKQGEVFLLKRDFERAAKWLEVARTINQALFNSNDVSSAMTIFLLAKVHFSQGKLYDAEQLLKQSLSIIETQLGKENAHYAQINATLADFYLFRSNRKVAKELLQISLQTMTTIYGLYNPRLIFILEQLAEIADNQDKPHQALDYMRRALAIKQRAPLNQLPKKEMIQLYREGIVL